MAVYPLRVTSNSLYPSLLNYDPATWGGTVSSPSRRGGTGSMLCLSLSLYFLDTTCETNPDGGFACQSSWSVGL